MAEPASQRHLKEFISALDSTLRWLDTHYRSEKVPAQLREFAGTLRRYVEHCRRHAKSGVSRSELDYRRRKLDAAVGALIEATMELE